MILIITPSMEKKKQNQQNPTTTPLSVHMRSLLDATLTFSVLLLLEPTPPTFLSPPKHTPPPLSPKAHKLCQPVQRRMFHPFCCVMPPCFAGAEVLLASFQLLFGSVYHSCLIGSPWQTGYSRPPPPPSPSPLPTPTPLSHLPPNLIHQRRLLALKAHCIPPPPPFPPSPLDRTQCLHKRLSIAPDSLSPTPSLASSVFYLFAVEPNKKTARHKAHLFSPSPHLSPCFPSAPPAVQMITVGLKAVVLLGERQQKKKRKI